MVLRSMLAIPAAMANILCIRVLIKQLLVLMSILFADALTRNLIQTFSTVSSEKGVDGLAVYDASPSDLWSRAMGSLLYFTKAATVYHLGRLSDRLGRRPVLLLGTFGLGISTVAMGTTSNLWLQNAARTVQGVCAGNIETTKTVMAEIATDTNRHLVYATIPLMQSVGVNFGTSIGSLLSGLNERSPFMQNHPLLIPCVFAGSFCFMSFYMAYKHLVETLPSDLLLDWKVVLNLKKTVETSVVDVSSGLLEHANDIRYGATSIAQKTVEEGIASVIHVAGSNPIKHVEGVLPDINVAENSSSLFKHVGDVAQGIGITETSTTLVEHIKGAVPDVNIANSSSSFLKQVEDVSSKVDVTSSVVKQAEGVLPDVHVAKLSSALSNHVEDISSNLPKHVDGVVPNVNFGTASSGFLKRTGGFLSGVTKASSNLTERSQHISQNIDIAESSSNILKHAENILPKADVAKDPSTASKPGNDVPISATQKTIGESISSNIGVVGDPSKLLKHIEVDPSRANIMDAPSDLLKHLEGVSPKTGVVEASSNLLQHVGEATSGKLPPIPKSIEEGISVVSQRVEQQLTSVIPIKQMRDVLHMKDMITPTFVRTLVNYSVVSFLDQSREVLLPIIYTSPTDSYGLGLQPDSLTKIMAKMGTYNVGVQAILFPWLMHRWGPKKLYSRCLFSMAMFFACFPLMLLSTRILDGGGILVWGMIYVQMALSSFTFMVDGCIQLLMMEAAPNKHALGTVNGMAQSIGSSSRMVAQLVISFGLAPPIAKQFFSNYFIYLFAFVMMILGITIPSAL